MGGDRSKRRIEKLFFKRMDKEQKRAKGKAKDQGEIIPPERSCEVEK